MKIRPTHFLLLAAMGLTLLQTGCGTLADVATAGAGGAGGALLGDKMSNGDPAATLLGGALGASVAMGMKESLQKQQARNLSRAFERGRCYERELEAQNEWYKATLEPEDPNWVPAGSTADETARDIQTEAPSTTVGGMNLDARTQTEQVLP